MCRHLGYLGPPQTLHSLIYDGEYSLETQAYAPRMTQGNLLNADGFGVGWYQDGEPVRFRRAQPLDRPVVPRGRRCRTCIMRGRGDPVGDDRVPVDESCAQPFRAGRWLFSHNGKIEGYGGIESKLRELVATSPKCRTPARPSTRRRCSRSPSGTGGTACRSATASPPSSPRSPRSPPAATTCSPPTAHRWPPRRGATPVRPGGRRRGPDRVRAARRRPRLAARPGGSLVTAGPATGVRIDSL